MVFGAALALSVIVSALVALLSPGASSLRRTRAHAAFVCTLAAPFFAWSIYLNLTGFDSGIVVFPVAAASACMQIYRPTWRRQRWVTFFGCLVPCVAYAGGLAVVALQSSPPALLLTYMAVAAVSWLALSIIGFVLCCRVETAGDATDLPAPIEIVVPLSPDRR